MPRKKRPLTSELHDPEDITRGICFSLQDDHGATNSQRLSHQWIFLDFCWHFVKHLACIHFGDCWLQEKENCCRNAHDRTTDVKGLIEGSLKKI